MGVAEVTASAVEKRPGRWKASTQLVMIPGKVVSSIRPARAGFMKLRPRPP